VNILRKFLRKWFNEYKVDPEGDKLRKQSYAESIGIPNPDYLEDVVTPDFSIPVPPGIDYSNYFDQYKAEVDAWSEVKKVELEVNSLRMEADVVLFNERARMFSTGMNFSRLDNGWRKIADDKPPLDEDIVITNGDIVLCSKWGDYYETIKLSQKGIATHWLKLPPLL